jgi:hypothetical protein
MRRHGTKGVQTSFLGLLIDIDAKNPALDEAG